MNKNVLAYFVKPGITFRFEYNKLTFRKKGEKKFRELPGHYPDGRVIELDKALESSSHWNQYTAQMEWYYIGVELKDKLQEYYKLFKNQVEKEDDMKHYIFFYTENFTFRMSKGVIEVYDKEKDEYGKVMEYWIDIVNDQKFINQRDFLDFNSKCHLELKFFIGNDKTRDKFLEFADILEKGVEVKE